MNKQSVSIIFIVVAVALLGSCAHYVSTYSGEVSQENPTRIGVVVDEWSQQERLATIMVSSLKARGYLARALFPNEVIPDDLLEAVSPGYTYSFGAELSSQVAQGGSIRGNANLIESLLVLNDIQDTADRYSDLLALRDQILNEWAVDYVMFIYPAKFAFAQKAFSYSVRVLRTSDREIVFASYVNANKWGWEQKVSRRSVTRDLDSGTVSISGRVLPLLFVKRRADAVEVEFCEYIATLVSGEEL